MGVTEEKHGAIQENSSPFKAMTKIKKEKKGLLHVEDVLAEDESTSTKYV